MPYSTSKFKQEIRHHLISKFPSADTTIIDVGAGAGSYFELLNDYYPMIDGIEIWEPYISEFSLEDKYRRIFNQNALDLFRDNEDLSYDCAILGDVLEHFDVNDAVSLVEHCVRRCSYVLCVVPFGCEQDEVYGNIYERHLQPDLNFQTMETRYGAYLQLLMHGFHSSDNEYEIAVYCSAVAI